MPARTSLEYVVIRVVPHVERLEFLNAGVVLFCKGARFLASRIDTDLARLPHFAPDAPAGAIRTHLALIPLICAGGPPSGPFAAWSASERFNWLAAPSSAIIQPSPVHGGVCVDPRIALDDLYDLLVRMPARL